MPRFGARQLTAAYDHPTNDLDRFGLRLRTPSRLTEVCPYFDRPSVSSESRSRQSTSRPTDAE
ncbi:MAG TPA: hypothetical protein DCQ98_21990 [Planctomycetaceae bacterium]|nr:hypothetical protein [Planctomycetaceae bacterium]